MNRLQSLAKIILFNVAISVLVMPAEADSARNLLPELIPERQQLLDAWWSDPSQSSVPLATAKLVWRLSRVSTESLDRLAVSQQDADLSELEVFETVSISGRAQTIRQIKVPESLSESLGMESIWIVEAKSGKDSFAVLCKSVPAQWVGQPEIDQPIRATSVVVVQSTTDNPRPLMVSPNVGWYPDSTSESLGVSAGWVELADAGFDAGQFTLIRKKNRTSLSSSESPAFYEFLSCSREPVSDDTEAIDLVPSQIETVDLLKSADLIGDYIRLRVETARIQHVYDASMLSKIGQDHYWEIDAFGDLENVRIQAKSSDGDDKIEFGNRYPVTIMTLELPSELSSLVQDGGTVTKAMLMHQTTLDVDGFFYRLWSYDTDFIGSRGGDQQIGPLIAARHIRVVTPTKVTASSQQLGWIAAGGFFFCLTATILYIVTVGKIDKTAGRSRHAALPQDISLSVSDDS